MALAYGARLAGKNGTDRAPGTEQQGQDKCPCEGSTALNGNCCPYQKPNQDTRDDEEDPKTRCVFFVERTHVPDVEHMPDV